MSEFVGEKIKRRSVKRGAKAVATAAALLLLPACTDGDKPVSQETTTTAPSMTAAELQVAASVQIRFVEMTGKGGIDPTMTPREQDLAASAPNCSATHVGDGWFATARHCYTTEMNAGAQLYDQEYDAIDSFPRYIEVWKGASPQELQKVGRADSLIIDGNYSSNDLALLHVPAAEDMPYVPVTATYPVDFDPSGKDFYVLGYPQATDFNRLQTEVDYSGLTSGAAMNDGYGLGDNYNPMYTFGQLAKPNEDLNSKGDIACTPGESGGSVVDTESELLGVLSRFDVPQGPIWQAQKDAGYDLSLIRNICVFQPITQMDVDRLTALAGVGPSEDSWVIYK